MEIMILRIGDFLLTHPKKASNILPFVLIAYSTTMKETYHNLQFKLEKIGFSEHKLLICTYLKVVAILTELQNGLHQILLLSVLVALKGKK